MKPSVWLGYLLGRSDAIREVAENRASIGTGIGLVLLTSVARNYDQTFIAEKPFLWLFGSLLFSVVSGTWLYVILYGWFVRRAAADADGRKPGFWSQWRCFMGLFWMTAPVAWLYAIPVERLVDSLTAAKLNLALLGIVSLWRVLLMARVVQCLTGARYYAVLLWVLFAAAVEILVVFFFWRCVCPCHHVRDGRHAQFSRGKPVAGLVNGGLRGRLLGNSGAADWGFAAGTIPRRK